MDTYEIKFTEGVGSSGRGVRYKMLTPGERDGLLLNVSKLAGPEATRAEIGLLQLREGVKAMLVAVTSGKEWVAVNMEKLSMPGPLCYDSLFTSKDDDILCSIYQRNHAASPAEVDAIVGKAQKVSTA